MGNEQEERQQNKISKINEGDMGSDGEQNNKEKERKKERKVAQRRGMEGDISFKKGRRATRRTKTLMSKKLCVYQISQLRKAETAVFSASCFFSPQSSSFVVFQSHQQQLPA